MPRRRNSTLVADDRGVKKVYAVRNFPIKTRLVLQELGRCRKLQVSEVISAITEEHLDRNPEDPAVVYVRGMIEGLEEIDVES